MQSLTHTFVVQGHLKSGNCSAVLGKKSEFVFGVTNVQDLEKWQVFFDNDAERAVVDPRFHQNTEGTEADFSEEEKALQEALATSRKMNQGLIDSRSNSTVVIAKKPAKRDTPTVEKNLTPVQRPKDASPGTAECVICMEERADAVCVPCGHNAACITCLEDIKRSTGNCPVCRKALREVVKLYHC